LIILEPQLDNIYKPKLSPFPHMIPIAKPLIGEEEKQAVLSVLASGFLAQGPKVKEFEQAFANYVGAKHAIATSNGTTALHAALLAHNIGTDDEVITSPFSFIATANTIQMTGATPVFVDIDPQTFNIDPTKIEQAITKNTKAIMPVHLYGNPADMQKIQAIAQKHNLIIIEDACQAHGAQYQLTKPAQQTTTQHQETQNHKVGSQHTACFSFYPTKNITTGEGGIITTNDDNLAQKIRKLIAHGSIIRYYHDHLGYNYRMTDICAAIGIEQLKKINQFNTARIKNATYLTAELSKIPGIIPPQITPGHVFHQYTIQITKDFPKTRNELSQLLTQHGIGNAIFYPVPIHKQNAYPAHNHTIYPITEKITNEVLSLPVHPSLTQQDLQHIITTLKEISTQP